MNEIQTLNINDFVICPEDFQLRNKTSKKLIKDYKTAYTNGQPIPPVTVAVVKGCMYLVDGFHRVEALKQLNQRSVEAVVKRGVKNIAEARWIAGKGNIGHGERYKTGKEKRRLFDVYIKAGQWREQDWSGVKSAGSIAGELGLISTKTVTRWLKADYPKIWWEIWHCHYKGDERFDLRKHLDFIANKSEKEAHEGVKRTRELLDTLKSTYIQYPTLGKKQQERIKMAFAGILKGLDGYDNGTGQELLEVKALELTRYEETVLKDSLKKKDLTGGDCDTDDW